MDRKEVEKELLKAAPAKIAEFARRREKMQRGHSAFQRKIEGIDQKVETIRARFPHAHAYQLDPHLRKITENMLRREQVILGRDFLICPKCGDTDHNNKMNGKPWCFKCNIELTPRNETANKNIRILTKREKLEEIRKTLHPGDYQ